LTFLVDNLFLGGCRLLEYLANRIQEFSLALVLTNLGTKSCFFFLLGANFGLSSFLSFLGFFQETLGSLLFRLVNLALWNEFPWLSKINHLDL
jgi:hypothetical protein